MRAIILSVGDELVSGLTINTNASWLGSQLAALGIQVAAHVTVPDDRAAIAAALRAAAAEVELILVSGGLGPTEDDLTRPALADALGETLVEDAAALAMIEAFFRARHRTMSPSNRTQAERPTSARCLENTCGTAPGLAAKIGRTQVFIMPGVPFEMKEMYARTLRPELEKLSGGRVLLTNKLNTFGLGESLVGEKIRDLMLRGALGPETQVGTTVAEGIVSVRIYSGGPPAAAAEKMGELKTLVRQRLGDLIFGEDDTTLAEAVGTLLKSRGQTVALAESCTGGWVGMLITDVPGSSAWFTRGFVTYANAAKTADLGVPEALLAAHGAVSEPVARAMAEGARRRAASDFALAVTGIAGPDGGTPEKPVGTVWVALAGPTRTVALRFGFLGSRRQVRQRAAHSALALLRFELLGVDPFSYFK